MFEDTDPKKRSAFLKAVFRGRSIRAAREESGLTREEARCIIAREAEKERREIANEDTPPPTSRRPGM